MLGLVAVKKKARTKLCLTCPEILLKQTLACCLEDWAVMWKRHSWNAPLTRKQAWVRGISSVHCCG